MSRTNTEVAERLGIDFTYASRLRAGKRMPSAKLLIRIIREFNLPLRATHEAYEAGPTEFARYLRARVWDEPTLEVDR